MGCGGWILYYCFMGIAILGCISSSLFELIMLCSNGLQIIPLLGSLISLIGICVVMTRDRVLQYNFDIYSEFFKLSLIFGTVQFFLFLPIQYDDDQRILLVICVAFFGQIAKCFIGYAVSSIFEEELNEKSEKYRKYLLSYYQNQAEALNDAMALIKESTKTMNSSEKLVSLFDRCGYKKLRKTFCKSDNKRNHVLIATLKQNLIGTGLDLIQDNMTVAQIQQAIEAQIPPIREKVEYYNTKNKYFGSTDFHQIKADYDNIRGISKIRDAHKSFWKSRAWIVAIIIVGIGLSSSAFYFFSKVDRTYKEALIQQADGHYITASAMLESIRWYKDADTIIENQKYNVEHERALSANIGDVVEFGECDDETLEVKGTIEWIVLAKENGKVFLLSKDILTHQPYNRKTNEVTWESSSIREWLNTTFYAEIFNDEERRWITQSTVENKDNIIYHTPAGNDTVDRIFLLSAYETNKLLKSKEASDWWWLRYPGVKENYAARISADGKFMPRGEFTTKYGGVRPAMWVS